MMAAQAVFEPSKPRFGVCHGRERWPFATPHDTGALESPRNRRRRFDPLEGRARRSRRMFTSGVVDGLVMPLVHSSKSPSPKNAIRSPRPRSYGRRSSETLRRKPLKRSARAVDGSDVLSVTCSMASPAPAKTEVYFEAVARTLRPKAARQQSCCLKSPSRPNSWTAFTKRFGAPPAEWHSALSPERTRPRLARSSLRRSPSQSLAHAPHCFCPTADLGLIVVDEEHDPGLQASRPRPLSGRAIWPSCARLAWQDPHRARLRDALH